VTALPVVDFLLANFPSPVEWAGFGPPSLLLAWAYLRAAGWLKRDRGWRTGYTRKVFHFLVFTTAAAVQAGLGFSVLAVFGAATSLVIAWAVLCGEGHVLYEAMARESDAPRRTLFIVTPYAATLLGGVLANAFFGDAAVYGYLVAGLGDAAGEPAGTRFGRHRYRVPSAGGVVAYRSWEGSAAVFAVSLVALVLAALLAGAGVPGFGTLALVALAATAVEALSPHGWDNLTMQLVPAALAAYLWT
jgi:phytol kinase